MIFAAVNKLAHFAPKLKRKVLPVALLRIVGIGQMDVIYVPRLKAAGKALFYPKLHGLILQGLHDIAADHHRMIIRAAHLLINFVMQVKTAVFLSKVI